MKNLKIKEFIKNKTFKEFNFFENFEFEDNSKHFDIFNFDEKENADFVFLFLHSGIKMPEIFSEFFIDDTEKIAETIYQNYDIGTRYLANELTKKIKNQKLNFKASIIFYSYSRIFTDVNRLRRHEQMTDFSYRGNRIWKNSINSDSDSEKKYILGEKLIDPFFEFTRKKIKKLNPKFVFHIHTYDKTGGGKASSNHEISTENMRPPSMIFQKYSHPIEALGIYGKADKSMDINFLNNDQIKIIQKIQNKNLSKIKNIEPNFEVPVDRPYISPVMFPGLIFDDTEIPQIALENRKDLFSLKNGKENILNSIIEICENLNF